MQTEIFLGSIFQGTGKSSGKPYKVVHYLFKNEKGQILANSDFNVFQSAFDKALKLTPGKWYKAEVNYINRVNVLIDILE